MGSSCSSTMGSKNVASNKQPRKGSNELYKASSSKSPFPNNDTTSSTSTKITLRPSHSSNTLTQFNTPNNHSNHSNFSTSGSVKGASSNHQPTMSTKSSTSTIGSSFSSKKMKKKTSASSGIIVQPDVLDPVVYAEREIEKRQRDPRTSTLRMSLDNFKFPSDRSIVSYETY